MPFFRTKSPYDFLVAGLGNPGRDYENTRHNAGFMALDALAERCGADVSTKRFSALTAKATLGGVKLLLMKPQTYMNASGDAISAAASYYKIPPGNVIVLCDDIALPLGKIRVRGDGSAGGHNGLKSIIAQLGTQDFPRIRIGVGGESARGDELINHVLGHFPSGELKTVRAAAKGAADAAEKLMRDGVAAASTAFNGKTFG